MKTTKSVSRLLTLAGGVLSSLLLTLPITTQAQEQRVIEGHVPSVVAKLKPIDDVPATNHLQLVISLPLRNQPELDSLLGELTDSTSTNYHQWLTPDQFKQRFGPTAEDYQKVVEFAHASGLNVTALAANNLLVDVDAPVANIEKAFHVKLHHYPHPTEARNFYAPDSEPTVSTNIPILHIRGLDNFILPYRLGGALHPQPLNASQITAYYTGSAPGGYFMGNDFRAAYAPGVTNTGAGQYIAIIDVGGPYYTNDIYQYELAAGLSTSIKVTNVLLSGSSGIPTGTDQDDGEEALDICMAMSMAPAATILNYEGNGADIFNQIAIDNKAKQMTLSYGFGIDAGIIQSFQEFLAQGQAMSQASGDGDSDLNGGTGLTGNPYATVVGGTTLTTTTSGGPWSSETAWNWGGNGGSGGGISGYGIPNWQQGISMTANLGSTTFRNYPDVAMPADGVYLISRNDTSVGSVGGTSCASPLWAGFMALVNQQAASLGNPSIGFANPPVYAIGRGARATYTSCFHDIATGNNFDSQNPTRFPAVAGYDLCTGWGTPTGSNTINALAGSGTNDFTFFASPDALSLVRSGNAASTLSVTRENGYAGSVTFALTGVPAGVTATLSPATTSTTSFLTFNTTSATAVGTNLITITGTSGTLVHSITVSLAVTAPTPGATSVSLSSFYNRPGIWTDGRTFSGGLDGGGYAYSANLLGTVPSWNGLAFTLGPTNANDAISCNGQTITLPQGNFTTLQILGTAVQGSQASQIFTVTYTDNSTATISQSFSDWANPQDFANEAIAVPMNYRDGSGSKDLNTAVNLYGYSLPLNQTKTVKSLKLPVNANVEILAMTLANDPISASLAGYYVRPGMYTDGTTFTNPATGGIDGSGSAYSATLLGGSQTWTNTQFSFGPANVTNVVVGTNQTITLPPGYFGYLRILGTGLQGGATSQSFTVKYTDGTSTLFTQSFSDWFSPKNYTGEAQALIEGHRNSSDGTKDERTFYVYGYSFRLNSAKVVQSIKLPNNVNVAILAISLVPEWLPVITNLPVASPITYGQTLANSALSGGAASVPGTFAFATPAAAPNAGTISASITFTPTDGNDYYTITTNVNVTVTPAAPVITTPPSATAIVYGQTLAASTLSGGSGSVPGTFAFTSPAFAPLAGTNGESVTFTPSDTNDYSPVVSSSTVFVMPAPLIVTASNAARNYGATNPVLTGAITGIQFGDNITATFATTALTNSPIGNYPITISLIDPNGLLVNYVVTTNIGTLTVNNVAPAFSLNPFTAPAAVAGQVYSGSLATNATDFNGESLRFSLVGGPSWLSLSTAGMLGGEPLAANIGTNSFEVSVTDAGGLSSTAVMNIVVSAGAPFISIIGNTGTTLTLSWSGGVAPYQVQMSTDLAGTNWVNLGAAISTNTAVLQLGNPAAFYRIVGQ